MTNRVRVAVIDSGWDRTILEDRVLQGRCFIDESDARLSSPSTDDQDCIGHGTRCADLVLQRAPHAEILPLRVFRKRLETSPDILIAALNYAVDCSARVINLSLSTSRSDAAPGLYMACERAARHGAIVVAAARPQCDSARSYPSAFEPVIGVDGRHMDPGTLLYARDSFAEVTVANNQASVRGLGGRLGPASGVSFAAATVSGRIAGMLATDADLTIDDVRRQLEALSIRTEYGGHFRPEAAARAE